jgi:hypothetical protein
MDYIIIVAYFSLKQVYTLVCAAFRQLQIVVFPSRFRG